MKKVIAYKAFDGKLFEEEKKCLEYESQFQFRAWITYADNPCCPEDFKFLDLTNANIASTTEELENATIVWVKDQEAIKTLENISPDFIGLEVGFNFWEFDGWTTLDELKNRFKTCMEKVKYFELFNF